MSSSEATMPEELDTAPAPAEPENPEHAEPVAAVPDPPAEQASEATAVEPEEPEPSVEPEAAEADQKAEAEPNPVAEQVESEQAENPAGPAVEQSEPVAEAEQQVGEAEPESESAEQESESADGEAEETAEVMDADDLLGDDSQSPEAVESEVAALKAVVEAVVYVTEEPLTLEQIASALELPKERVQEVLAELAADYARADRGIAIREVAGGYKMGTKPEHHEAIRSFVKKLKPPLKLSLAALETLAVIAYKQPITAPEIQEVRGVQGAGVLKTLIDRKLITPAGRKNVIGKPILYKTTKEFLLQFGLRDLAELPTLKEFEELRRLAFPDDGPSEVEAPAQAPNPDPPAGPVEPTAAPAPVAEAAEGSAQEPAPEQSQAESEPSVPEQSQPEQS